MPLNDPVTNPLGALQELAVQRAQSAVPQQQAQLSKLMAMADGNPATAEAERWGAMAQAASMHPPVVGGFGQLLASIGGAYGKTLAAQEQQAFNNNLAVSKVMDSPSMWRIGGGRPAAGAQGVVTRTDADGNIYIISKADGSIIHKVSSEQSPQYVKLVDRFFQEAMERGEYATVDEAREWAQDQAARTLGRGAMRAPAATAPVAEEPAARQRAPEIDMPPQDAARWMKTLKRQQEEAAALGNYEEALRLKTALQEMQNAAGAGGAAPMPRLDTAAKKGREKTAEESAKIYADSFEEQVVKPAAAFTNTAKIMQEFNNLGQMQSALKNGKLKEYMAGEGGKWVLQFVDKNSDLAKGIANAQEAEKLTAGMVNQILLAAKGVQTEGDAQRAKSQVTQVGVSEDANRYVEAYVAETARQLQMREKFGRSHKNASGTYEGYDDAWRASPLMKEARGSVKKLGNTWIGVTQYMEKFLEKNPTAKEQDAIRSWNALGAKK